MSPSDLKSLRSRLNAVGIRQQTFAAFAQCHDADVSRVIRGLHVAPAPVARMVAAIEALEDLVNAVRVRPALDSVANINAALKCLEEKRTESSAAKILADDAKKFWARAVAVPSNPEMLSDAAATNE
jgi:hypothetical protein